MIEMLKKITLILLAIMSSAVILASCSQKKEEFVDISTSLQFDNAFAGSRTVTMTFPESTTGSNTETSLDKVVQKYCPETMEYSKDISDGKIKYSFVLKFNSVHDYSQKIEKITGTPVKVAFSNPDNVLTHGWKLQEDFSSTQLFKWIHDGANAENFDDLDFKTSEKNSFVEFDKDKIETTPIISVNNLSGYPIQKITIDTVNKKDVFDRTISFTISQTTFDELNDKLTNYFKGITTGASKSDWLIDNEIYTYKVRYDDISLQELSGYTNNLLSSVYCDVSYTDKSVGSTPLAEQNSFTETLDFSNYISNSGTNVPIEYTYKVDDSSELSECQLYENSEWTPATNLMDSNIYGKFSAVKSTDSFIKLRINDGKQYNCSSIDIDCTALDGNTLEKAVTFKYDIATGGNEAVKYALSYFEHMGINAEQDTEGGKNTCTIKFTGTPEEVNSNFSKIFGSQNKTDTYSYVPFMTLRTTKRFTDHIDLSSLIVGKNVDTPVNYYVIAKYGDIIKKVNVTYPSENANSENKEIDLKSEGVVFILQSPCAEVHFDVSTPNVSDIIAMCIISVIITAGGITALFLLRKRHGKFIPAEAVEVTPLPENEKRQKLEK